ncbi:MAG: hypothetical protein SPK50_08160 [Mobiluncus porci]|uniref:Uncharacterized protein n=1 Tax=Mobiluncus porci TaxID=2652278 RepID=A0A7K0K5Z3_9ACTO|nr:MULTISPECIES: hypothetical protein [Mobiluncus]MCI6584962.1 hypothetical protein [Mobiluncus sp.]MDD7542286.1 hypothetical protein [Mobiluncus porci]MDY5749085.1 hypothetical protein [Mobiluncus porci]MST50480.1 hypothetical protein [Mobiluncus porci]
MNDKNLFDEDANRGPEPHGDNAGFDFDQADQAQFDAQFEDLISKLGDLDDLEPEPGSSDLDQPQQVDPLIISPQARAVFLTPVASAEALAALCALSGIDLVIVPTEVGAVGVSTLEINEEAFGMALLAETLEDFDPKLDGIIAELNQLTKMPVVAIVGLLAPGTEMEPGVTGQVLAARWVGGEFETDLPAGLVVAQMPLQVEDLVLGRVEAIDQKGAVETKGIARWKALRMLGKGLKNARREAREKDEDL